MAEKTIFPREEKSEALFKKILSDPWACEKLQETFCKYLFAVKMRLHHSLHPILRKHYSTHMTTEICQLF